MATPAEQGKVSLVQLLAVVLHTIFKSFICNLKQPSLLGVHAGHLGRSHGEERAVEPCEIIFDEVTSSISNLMYALVAWLSGECT
jgi:hypothetical protein